MATQQTYTIGQRVHFPLIVDRTIDGVVTPVEEHAEGTIKVISGDEAIVGYRGQLPRVKLADLDRINRAFKAIEKPTANITGKRGAAKGYRNTKAPLVPEAVIQRQSVELLTRAGWFVTVFSQRKRVEGGIVSHPDVEAIKHGVTLKIEFKRADGALRPGQVEYAERIKPHLSPSLRYCVARSVDDVERIISL